MFVVDVQFADMGCVTMHVNGRAAAGASTCASASINLDAEFEPESLTGWHVPEWVAALALARACGFLVSNLGPTV